jgi:hypothetical protein
MVNVNDARKALADFYCSPVTGEWILDTEESALVKALYDATEGCAE